MPTILKTKNSVTTTVVPTTLQQGELAVNITDKKMWVGNAATTPVQLFGAGADGSFVNLAYTGTLTGGTGVVNLGSGQFYKDASGNIGLGTASPDSKLDVVGNIQARTASDGGLILTTAVADARSATVQFKKSRGSYASPTDVLNGDAVASILSLPYSGTQYRERVSIESAIDGTFITNQAPPLRLVFYTNAANGTSTERMRITSAGDVGIGTSGPNSRLQVLGTTNSGYATSNAIASGGSAISNSGALSSGSSLRLTANFGGAVNFAGRASELVFGADNGNFGGGGGFPQANLGAITSISENGNATTLASSMLFYTSAGNNISERMRITSAGNVGIGLSSPSRELTVYGTSPSVQLQNATTGTANTDGLQIQQSGLDAYIWNWEGGAQVFATSGTEQMRITSAGVVGMGTSSPAGRLTVLANNLSDGIVILGNDNANTKLRLTNSGTGGESYQIQVGLSGATNTGLVFRDNTAGATRMVIDSSGNLLLGGRTSTANSARIAVGMENANPAVMFDVTSNFTRATGVDYGAFIYRDTAGETNAVTFVENNGAGNNAASYVVRTNAATGGTGFTSVSGGVALVNGATSWSSYSDLRLKHDVTPITNATELLLQIDPIYFKWNDKPDTQLRSLGVSAQSVEKVLPELIDRSGVYDIEGGAMQVRYTELIPVLISSIQELKAELDSVKAELQTLKGN